MRLRPIGLIITLTLAISVAPLAADAQQAGKVWRIGWLVYGSPSPESSLVLDEGLRQGLRDLGYIEGKNIAIEYRYAEGRPERLPGLAADLVRLKVDLIIAPGDMAKVAREATGTIPIVMMSSNDPVRAGYVASLAQPGGNVTGVTFIFDELAGKRLELLKEAVPAITRVAVLWNPTHVDNEFREMQAAARALGIQLQSLELRAPSELDGAIQAASRGRAEALTVAPSRLTAFLRRRIIELAAKARLPVISGWREFAEAGGLLTYGPNRSEGARRAAAYIDKILKGAKPADLPVEQPTRFELVINLKTAKALGLTIPQSVLIRADQVIQ
jgi:putative ABC transport system substrate-binding protein